MAFEIRVTVEVRDLSPVNDDGFSLLADNAGVWVRSEKSSTMATETDNSVENIFTLATARLDSIGDEVLTDAKAQLQIFESNARKVESES